MGDKKEKGKKKEKKNKGGRGSKFSEEIVRKLIASIQAGNYIETACRYAGISHTTFYRWLEKGEKSRSGKFRDFVRQIEEALAISEQKMVLEINKAEDWRAKAWLLERRFPERWGRRDFVQMEHKGEVNLKNEIIYDEEVIELVDKLTKKLSE